MKIYRVKQDNTFFAEFQHEDKIYSSDFFYEKERALDHARAIYRNIKHPELIELRKKIMEKLQKEEYDTIRDMCRERNFSYVNGRTRHEMENMLADAMLNS